MVLSIHIQPTTTVAMTTVHVGQMATGNRVEPLLMTTPDKRPLSL